MRTKRTNILAAITRDPDGQSAAFLAREFGLRASWPVGCGPFEHWRGKSIEWASYALTNMEPEAQRAERMDSLRRYARQSAEIAAAWDALR